MSLKKPNPTFIGLPYLGELPLSYEEPPKGLRPALAGSELNPKVNNVDFPN
jgi:hypothetical protein